MSWKAWKSVIDIDNSSVYAFQLMMSFRDTQGISCLSRADHVKLKWACCLMLKKEKENTKQNTCAATCECMPAGEQHIASLKPQCHAIRVLAEHTQTTACVNGCCTSCWSYSCISKYCNAVEGCLSRISSWCLSRISSWCSSRISSWCLSRISSCCSTQ